MNCFEIVWHNGSVIGTATDQIDPSCLSPSSRHGLFVIPRQPTLERLLRVANHLPNVGVPDAVRALLNLAPDLAEVLPDTVSTPLVQVSKPAAALHEPLAALAARLVVGGMTAASSMQKPGPAPWCGEVACLQARVADPRKKRGALTRRRRERKRGPCCKRAAGGRRCRKSPSSPGWARAGR